jgi:hypothetical protein
MGKTVLVLCLDELTSTSLPFVISGRAVIQLSITDLTDENEAGNLDHSGISQKLGDHMRVGFLHRNLASNQSINWHIQHSGYQRAYLR